MDGSNNAHEDDCGLLWKVIQVLIVLSALRIIRDTAFLFFDQRINLRAGKDVVSLAIMLGCCITQHIV